MKRTSFWDQYDSWQEAEEAWDAPQANLQQQCPLNEPKNLPNIPGITKDTAKNLKWKSLKYMVSHDATGKIRQHFFQHPLKYGRRLLKSALKSTPYKKDDDFFLYGVDSVTQFETLLTNPDSIWVVGFSYCHKPHECPSGRFTDACIRDPDHPVCRQCFIGKALHALPQKNSVPLVIPTIHYIGEQIFDVVHKNEGKQVLFLISACELCLKMFGDWGNMVNIKGVGIRLDGRICNTMKAFELSEHGVKPGLTVILEPTKQRILDLIRLRRQNISS